MIDIVVTWPKARALDDYLGELQSAVNLDLEINYKVPTLPREIPRRCFMVHSGYVRGYNVVRGMGERDDVIDPKTGAPFPRGLYIIRNPRWYPLDDQIPMRGFQGWRYFDEEEARAAHN